MTSGTALLLDGSLKADGTIQLDRLPSVRPGRVRITMRPLSASERGDECLPDGPWQDDTVSAPIDLPLSGSFDRVTLRQAHALLPDPPATDEERG
ncbi:MAG: hypothetical protein WCJ35_11540 [Planctomycetota bacterium]